MPRSAIYIHCQHTHTAPYVDPERENLMIGAYAPNEMELILEYQEFVMHRLVDCALDAIASEKPAKMGYGIGRASGIAFIPPIRAIVEPTVAAVQSVSSPQLVARRMDFLKSPSP